MPFTTSVLTIPVILNGEYLKWRSISKSILHIIEELMLRRMRFSLIIFVVTYFSSFTEYVMLIGIAISPADVTGSFPSKILMRNVNQSKSQIMRMNTHYCLKTRVSL